MHPCDTMNMLWSHTLPGGDFIDSEESQPFKGPVLQLS